MRIPKGLTAKLIFEDAFHPDPKLACLNKLRALYNGKCFKACLIKEVKELNQMSLWRATSSLDASFTVSVSFTVDCIVYLPGETIMAKIIKIEQERIYLENADADIQIQNTPECKILSVGMMVPIVVVYSRCIQMRTRMSVLATINPWSFEKPEVKKADLSYSAGMLLHDNVVYHVSTEHQTDPDTKVMFSSEDIAQLLPQLDETPTLKYFNELLVGTASGEKKPNYLSLKGLLAPGYYKRPKVALHSDWIEKTDKGDVTLVATPPVMQKILLNKYLHNLLTLKELTEAYPTMQAINANKKILNLLKMEESK